MKLLSLDKKTKEKVEIGTIRITNGVVTDTAPYPKEITYFGKKYTPNDGINYLKVYVVQGANSSYYSVELEPEDKEWAGDVTIETIRKWFTELTGRE